MKTLEKTWNIIHTDTQLSAFEKVCINRGLTTEQDLYDFVHILETGKEFDPHLMKDMDKAIERIFRAISQKEKIMIFGDYDVDGMTSGAVMFLGLKKFGALVSYRLPHREKDGYGLNTNFVDECKEIGVDLIVTVDCGISNVSEVEYIHKLGMDVIVTDHHHVPPKIPNALAVINPQQKDCPYPFAGVSGSVVAYKVICALSEKYIQKESDRVSFLNNLLELASMGIVADCCPLISENRYMVTKGLELLKGTSHIGVRHLLETCGVDIATINSETIGFTIGPRLNAAGRLSSPYHGIELLLGKTEKSEVLNKLNKARQDFVANALESVYENIENMDIVPKVIVAHDENWHVGVVGLLAGKLTEKYYRPSLVLQKKGEVFVGSARSVEGVNVMAILEQCRDLFTHFGGHKQAAGFSLPCENLEIFKQRIQDVANESITPDQLIPKIDIDCVLRGSEINFELINLLKLLEPYGIKNERPLFLVERVAVYEVKALGKQANHLKFTTHIEGEEVDIIAFHKGEDVPKIQQKTHIDIVCELQVNEWQGKQKLQLRMKDWR